MGESILTDTKKNIGITESDTSFDDDIIMHLNSVFSTLQQLGVGPDDGFMVEDSSDEWYDFIGENNSWNFIRSYIFLKVKMLFDPPSTSFHLEAMNKQIQEFEFRISVNREWQLNPVDPMSVEEEDDSDDD